MTRDIESCARQSGPIRSQRAGGRAPAVALALVVLGAGTGGCGGPEREQSAVESEQSALGTFTSWTPIGQGRFLYGPTVAAANSTGANLVGVGLDYEVYTTNQFEGGGFGTVFRRVSSFGLPCATSACPSQASVTAVGLMGEQGTMADAIVMAYHHPVDGKIYIRVQNPMGSIVFQDWQAIPSPLSFDFPIALAWAPRTASAGAQRRLFLVTSTPSNPNSVYMSGNTLTNGVYNHANWSPFAAVATGNKQFTSSIWSLALSWACPPSRSDYSLVLAAEEYPTDNSTSNGLSYYTRFFPSSNAWTGWSQAQNLFTRGAIASAPTCGEFSHGMYLFGSSGPLNTFRPFFTNQVGGGPATWTPIGTETPVFVRGAGLSGGQIIVTAKNDVTKVPYYSVANGF